MDAVKVKFYRRGMNRESDCAWIEIVPLLSLCYIKLLRPALGLRRFQGTIQALHRHSWREMKLQNRRGPCVFLSLALGPGLKVVPASHRPLTE